jgi:2-hydroxychromene-2-carboxylate isomerase
LRTLRFYFDYISSNAHLAWKQLPALASRFGVTVEPVPVLFAGLLEAHGQLGPAEVRPKAIWMAKNNLRKAVLLGLPLNRPRHHPFSPLLSLRLSGLPLPDAERSALIDALFDAVWVNGIHVSEPEAVTQLVNEIGLDGPALVAAAQRPEAKARLREQTDAAIARGVFGVPSMLVENELFWGYDDWPYLELYLAGKDPIDSQAFARWVGASPMQPSAQRRRFRAGEGS